MIGSSSFRHSVVPDVLNVQVCTPDIDPAGICTPDVSSLHGRCVISVTNCQQDTFRSAIFQPRMNFDVKIHADVSARVLKFIKP